MRAGKYTRHTMVSVALVGAMATAGLTAATASGAVTSHTVQNKSITFAEAPGANPNWILPYDSCQYFSVDNINQFQELMFRPLYWFGLGSSAQEVPSLSIGNPPVETAGQAGHQWTVTVKPWNFAGSGKVSAANVKFFLDLYKADPSGSKLAAAFPHQSALGGYCGYNANYGIPDDLTGVTAVGQKVTLTFATKSIQNKLWMLYNNLSQVTPMPISWDTSAGHRCTNGAFNAPATNTACVQVENALLSRASHLTGYNSAFWQAGVTGPWKLTSFNALGDAKFVPNTKYSGPVKAKVAHFNEQSFVSTAAEEAALGAGTIQLGFLDPTYLSCCSPSPGVAGPNVPFLSAKYRLTSGTEWGFNYAAMNFNSKLIDQLYIRQALNYGDDQAAILHSVDKGYGNQTWSPLPYHMPGSLGSTPSNPYTITNTSWQTGQTLLENHGWALSGGVMHCTSPGTAPGDCGAGIGNNQALNITVDYLTQATSPSASDTMNAEITEWSQEGFNVTGNQDTFNNTITKCLNASQPWDLCSWGGGWIYAPDYEPTGESLFATGGGFNIGLYSDGTMDSLIHATDYGTANLTAFGAYAAQQLPDLYQATPAGSGEVLKALKGLQPPNPLGNLMPEYDHY